MLAGPASRFVSALVDILIQLVLLVCVAIVLGIVGSAALGGGGIAVLLWFVLSFAVIAFYDIFFEVFRSGQTPGKRMNGLRVVRVPNCWVPGALPVEGWGGLRVARVPNSWGPLTFWVVEI